MKCSPSPTTLDLTLGSLINVLKTEQQVHMCWYVHDDGTRIALFAIAIDVLAVD